MAIPFPLGTARRPLLPSRPMQPVRSLLIFFLAVFVGGALLAPWLYWLAQWAAPHARWLEDLARSPFHRFVTRSFLLVALLGTWPLLRALNVRSWNSLGLVRPAGQWSRFGGGFALGFGSLACLALLALAFGARQFDDALGSKWVEKLPAIAATALVVAVLEEFLFRGILVGALKRVHGLKIALVGSSTTYAMTHFFQRVKFPEPVAWNSGLALLPQMASGFADVTLLLPGFLVLTLTGATLALAFQRTGNLWFSIGLHAGWIFWLKSYNVITDARPSAAAWFWGTGKLIDGWLALFVVAAAAMAVVSWNLQPQPQTQALVADER